MPMLGSRSIGYMTDWGSRSAAVPIRSWYHRSLTVQCRAAGRYWRRRQWRRPATLSRSAFQGAVSPGLRNCRIARLVTTLNIAREIDKARTLGAFMGPRSTLHTSEHDVHQAHSQVKPNSMQRWRPGSSAQPSLNTSMAARYSLCMRVRRAMDWSLVASRVVLFKTFYAVTL